MKILHTSDLHSSLIKTVNNQNPDILDKFDVWIDSGDFFPNFPIIKYGNGSYNKFGKFMRNIEYKIDRPTEQSEQKKWLKNNMILDHMVKWLDGRPFVSVQGNHDFISLVDELKDFGYENAYEITTNGFDLLGYKWAGFPNINLMEGMWNHETCCPTFLELISELEKTQPDILVTHSPPSNILDEVNGEPVGIPELANALSYRLKKVRWAFFGHIHECGGKKMHNKEMNITFYNGSQSCILHNIS